MTTLPAPVQPKSYSMPGDHRFRFDDHQGRSPAAPELGEPNPQKSVSKAQARSVAAVRLLQYEELMPESQDLCMEHASIPETLPNRVEQREDDREHGICKLSLPSFKFNWLNENRVFSRDTSVSKGKRLFSWHQRGSLRSIKVLQERIRVREAFVHRTTHPPSRPQTCSQPAPRRAFHRRSVHPFDEPGTRSAFRHRPEAIHASCISTTCWPNESTAYCFRTSAGVRLARKDRRKNSSTPSLN